MKGALEPAFTSLEEAATFLGISRSTAYRLARSGRFPVRVVEVGGRRVVSIEALQALAASAAEPVPAPRRLRSVG